MATPCGRARGLARAGEFPPGSMGPKIDAALSFLTGGGTAVLITSLARLGDALAGACGTWIVP